MGKFLFLFVLMGLPAHTWAQKVPLKLKSTSLEEVKKCLALSSDVVKNLGQMSLDTIKSEIEKKYELKNENLNYSWFELKKENGERLSLRVNSVIGPNGIWLQRMQLYAYDAAGVPQERRLPKEHEQNPSEKIIKNYLDSAEILSSERSLSYLAFPGARLNLIYQKNTLAELEFFRLSGSQKLLCRNVDMARPSCQCF